MDLPIFFSGLLALILVGLNAVYSRAGDKKRQALKVDQIAQALRDARAARDDGSPRAISSSVALNSLNSTNSTITLPAASPQPTDEVRSLIEGLVNGYHQQALAQAKQQFWFSVGAASVGFIWILVAGLTVGSSDYKEYFRLLPGTVIEVVSIMFFKQSAEIRARATELYDKLRTDNQTAMAVALVKGIEDRQVRSIVQAQLALHLAGLAPTAIDLPNILTKSPESREDAGQTRSGE